MRSLASKALPFFRRIRGGIDQAQERIAQRFLKKWARGRLRPEENIVPQNKVVPFALLEQVLVENNQLYSLTLRSHLSLMDEKVQLARGPVIAGDRLVPANFPKANLDELRAVGR